MRWRRSWRRATRSTRSRGARTRPSRSTCHLAPRRPARERRRRRRGRARGAPPPCVVRGARALLDGARERPLGGGVAGAPARLRGCRGPASRHRRHVCRVRLGRGGRALPRGAHAAAAGHAVRRGQARAALRAAAYAEQASFELAWGRIFFVYGPGEPDGRLVPSVGRALLAGEPVPTTRGDQIRDFMHVEDAARCLRSARGQPRDRRREHRLRRAGDGARAGGRARRRGRPPDLLRPGRLARPRGGPATPRRRCRRVCGTRSASHRGSGCLDGLAGTLEWLRARRSVRGDTSGIDGRERIRRPARTPPTAGPAAIRGGVIRVVGFGAGVAMTALSAALLFRHLGVDDGGRYVTVLALVSIVAGLTDAGLTGIAMRELVVRDPSEREPLLRNLIGMRIVLGVVGLAGAVRLRRGRGLRSAMVVGTALAGFGDGHPDVPEHPRRAADGRPPPRLGDDPGVRPPARDGRRDRGAGGRRTPTLVPFLALLIPASLVAVGLTVWLVRGEVPMRPSFDWGEWRTADPGRSAVRRNRPRRPRLLPSWR